MAFGYGATSVTRRAAPRSTSRGSARRTQNANNARSVTDDRERRRLLGEDRALPSGNSSMAAILPTGGGQPIPGPFNAGTGGAAPTAPGAGGVTGAGAGSGDLMSPFTGFAAPFRPAAAPMIFQEPQILLQQAMRNMGLNPQSAQGLYQMALPGMDYANALAMLALGQGSDLGAGGANQALNFIGNYATQGITPGGQAVDFNKGLAALQGAGRGQSVLGDFLNIDDPRQQIANYKSLALPLAAAGLHPLFARAFENAINQAGDQYMYSIAGPGNANSNFVNYFGQNAIGR